MGPDASRLAPENSPALGPKRARRLNNKPVFIALSCLLLAALALAMVLVDRAGRFKERLDLNRERREAEALAGQFITGEAGLIERPGETPAPPPGPAAVVLPVGPPPPPPAAPRPSEESRRARDKRLRLVEAALDGPIQARLESPAVPELGRAEAASGSESGVTSEADRGAGGTGGDGWSHTGRVEAPVSPHIVRAGWVIPAILISGINSSLPGQILAQTAIDVYDTPSGRRRLIPRGTRLVGEYSSDIQYGQSRVLVSWRRLVFPDGKALDIGAMPGSSGAGYAGVGDRVNNHYLRTFGSAILMSAILAGVGTTQAGRDGDGSRQRMADALSESLGQVMGGVMAEMLSKNLNLAPTLEIRPGYRFNVMLTRDLIFPGPYGEFDYVKP
jgi:type IV secretory pathway VirB10-like protein